MREFYVILRKAKDLGRGVLSPAEVLGLTVRTTV